jgi:uncharacterized protein YggU (UPF0235/DUF167 family)
VVDGVLHVRVAAPPADGAANEALTRLIARDLDVGRSAVRLVSGATARRKVLGVRVERERIAARWPGLGL